MKAAVRTGEAQTLGGLLDEAMRAQGGVALVSGAPGMGKSSLLAALTDEAARRGAMPLAATCSRTESGLAFGVIGQLLSGAAVSEADRCQIGQLIDAAGVDGSAGSAVQAVAQRVGAVLAELTEHTPLVLAVDDIQYADQPSALCLSYMVRRIRPVRALAVFTQQEISWQQPTDLQAELLRLPRCELVRLAPLTEAEVAAMIEAELGNQAAGRLAGQFHTISGGSPLLVRALLADHSEPADAYSLAVLSCLGNSDLALREIAAALAVLGEGESDLASREAGLARLVGLEAEVLEPRLAALGQAGITDSGHRFRHRRARSAILASLDPVLRADLHGRAAELAFNGGLPAEDVAEHLRAAASIGGAWAIPVLEEAARSAIDHGRLDVAVDYLKIAQDGCGDDQQRAAITTALVRAEWRINPSIPASELSGLVGQVRQGRLEGTDLVVLAKALLWHGQADDAIEVLERLGKRVANRPDAISAETSAELKAMVPWLRCTYPPVASNCPVGPAGGLGPATTTIGHRQEAAAALVAVLTEGPGAGVMPALERILRYSRLDDSSMDAEECALLAMLFSGRLDDADRWCELFTNEAVTRKATSRQARLAAIRTEICLRRGDLPDAARCGQQALALMPATGWGVAIGAPLSTLILAFTAMGRLDGAADLVRRPVPAAMLATRHGLQYLYARGKYQLAVGNAMAALRDFQLVGRQMREWQLDSPALVSWRLGAAEAMIRTGRRAQARELVEDQLALKSHLSGREQGSTQRLLALCTELGGRPPLLRRAAELLQEAGDRYELGRTLATLASAYHKSGEARRARTVRRQALTLAEECQAEPLARALAVDPDTSDKSEPSVLSETERRVADLAAIGYTNRDISDKLFITVSTVEQHLTRIYRKLNLTGRGELPASPALAVRG